AHRRMRLRSLDPLQRARMMPGHQPTVPCEQVGRPDLHIPLAGQPADRYLRRVVTVAGVPLPGLRPLRRDDSPPATARPPVADGPPLLRRPGQPEVHDLLARMPGDPAVVRGE